MKMGQKGKELAVTTDPMITTTKEYPHPHQGENENFSADTSGDKDVEDSSISSSLESHKNLETDDFLVNGYDTTKRTKYPKKTHGKHVQLDGEGTTPFCEKPLQSQSSFTHLSTTLDHRNLPSRGSPSQQRDTMKEQRQNVSCCCVEFRQRFRKRIRGWSHSMKPNASPGGNSNVADSGTERILEQYRELGYCLLSHMMEEEQNRTRALLLQGNPVMRFSKKSSDGWMSTVFVWKERSLDVILLPWTLCVANAVLWQILESTIDLSERSYMKQFNDGTSWESVHSIVFSTTLAFLLVFRLNRVALRWWETRRMWGVIVEQIRILVSSALEHLHHSPQNRDDAIAWSCAFAIASKQLLRDDTIVCDELAGILTSKEISNLQRARHFPLYSASRLRRAICEGLAVNEHTPLALATSHVALRKSLETNVDNLVANVGGMERVKATPLPLVYVSHLRTFLLLYLLSLPYLYGPSWQYWTIPFVALLSYALLGIDGAAAECEIPFDKHRPNHLDMERYCVGAFSNVIELMMIKAKSELRDEDGMEHDVEIEV